MLNTDLLKVKFLSKYTEQALEDYEADLRIKLLAGKNTISIMAKLASLCFFKKDYDMAVYFFEKLMKSDTTNGNWPGFLAYVYYEQEKDRKSTRLNSSHANISYAVFCLKKNITITYTEIIHM